MGNEEGLSALLEFRLMSVALCRVWSDCTDRLGPAAAWPVVPLFSEHKCGHVHISNLSVSCHVLSAGQAASEPTVRPPPAAFLPLLSS